VTNVVIRPFKVSEYETWAAMVYDYDPTVRDLMDATWSRLNQRQVMSGWFATIDRQPVGFLHYIFHDFCFQPGPIVYLSALYVMPEFRRQGVATGALDWLFNVGRQLEWARIYWVTEHDNVAARALYDKIAKPDFVRYHADL
jgi:GNAT superfamily N-acetyltransferase